MDTPRTRSPRPLSPLSSKPTALLPPPAPVPLSVSAATSPSHDFSYSGCSSPFGGLQNLLSMSRAPVGRVGSDLSHKSYSKANRHATTSYDRDGAKNRASPFFSGLGDLWRKESSRSSDDTTGGNKKPAEEKRKDKAKRALDLGQWVKKYMAAMVDQLRSSFYGRRAEREQRRRPHSFSARGSNAAREMKERARWRRRRGQHLSSAPASLRASPANSGHLSVGASVNVSTSSEESTMQELQSAIQAAIAHCKNSTSRAQ
jgi:BRI1 kinase inhibitor 1